MYREIHRLDQAVAVADSKQHEQAGHLTPL
jgi:hypothetical protein